MMGYRDPNDVDEEQEAAYWDMVLHDFGVAEYLAQRYMGTAQSKETVMEFTARVSGTTTVRVDTSTLDLDRVIDDVLPSDFDLDSADAQDSEIEVEVDFQGTYNVTLDDDDLADLARAQIEQAFSGTTGGVDIEDVEVA